MLEPAFADAPVAWSGFYRRTQLVRGIAPGFEVLENRAGEEYVRLQERGALRLVQSKVRRGKVTRADGSVGQSQPPDLEIGGPGRGDAEMLQGGGVIAGGGLQIAEVDA